MEQGIDFTIEPFNHISMDHAATKDNNISTLK